MFELNNENLVLKLRNITVELSAGDLPLLGIDSPEQPSSWTTLDQTVSADGLLIRRQHPLVPKVESIFKIRKKNSNSVEIERIVRNNSSHDLLIANWCDLSNLRIKAGVETAVYSVENCRMSFLKLLWDDNDEGIPAERPKEFSTFVNGAVYGEKTIGRLLTYGETEDQPFPAQVLVDPNNNVSLVIGLLSNTVADMCVNYQGKPCPEGQLLQINGKRLFRGQQALLVKGGEEAVGETIYLGITESNDLDIALASYKNKLKECLSARRQLDRQSVFEKGRIWGSWNLGIYTSVNHDLVVKQAQIIRETRQDLSWIQIDDGYTVNTKPGMFMLEGPGIDRQKFPKGLKATAAAIKALGLRPALWMGLIISPGTDIPDFASNWLLLKKDGKPLELPDGSLFIDYSVPEARDYLEHLVGIVTKEWGFEGIKFDFWSDHFHCLDIQYRNQAYTGAMLRDWFWGMLRRYVGPDGLLLTGCCIGNGNPFLSRFIDCFRCGIDVMNGQDTHGQESSVFWYGMLAKFGISDFIYPDMDSMGDFSQDIGEKGHRLWMSFVAASGANLEYGGKLDEADPEFGPKTVEAFNLVTMGEMATPIDFPEPLNGGMAPVIWVNRTSNGGRVVALCAWNNKSAEAKVKLDAQAVGIESFEGKMVREFWSDLNVPVNNDSLELTLPLAGDGMLLVIS